MMSSGVLIKFKIGLDRGIVIETKMMVENKIKTKVLPTVLVNFFDF